MSIVDTADQVYRDYAIDDDPASGAHKPIKSEIRDLHEEISAAIGAIGAATGVSGVIDLGKTNIDTTGTDDVSPRIIEAIADIAANGGGTVLLPPGVFRIDSTIEVPYNNVTIAGVGWGINTIDTEPDLRSQQSTRIVWGGAVGGTMVKFLTPNEMPTKATRRYGGGLQFLTLDGNWVAGVGLNLTAWVYGLFNRLNIIFCTQDQLLTEVPFYDPGSIPPTSGVSGGNGGVQLNIFESCQFTAISTGTGSPGVTSTANGVRLTGRASVGGNTSGNSFYNCRSLTRAGVPYLLECSDDNKFQFCGGSASVDPDDPGHDQLQILAVTKASPAVITYAASDNHPTNGWKVFVDHVYGMTELSGHIYTLRNVNTTGRTVELYNEANTTPIDSTAYSTFLASPTSIDGVTTPFQSKARAMPVSPGFVFGSADQDSIDGTTPARRNYIITLDSLVRGRASQTGGLSSHDNHVFYTKANNNPEPQIERGAGGSDDGTIFWNTEVGDTKVNTLAVSGIRRPDNQAFQRAASHFFTGNCPPVSTTHGTDTTPDVTWMYVAEIFLPVSCFVQGIKLMVGSAAVNSVTCAVYDRNGVQIRKTVSAALSGGGIGGLVTCAWTTSVTLELSGPRLYYIGAMFNNVACRFRTHAVGGFATGTVTGLTYAGGPPATITLPTTFTASVGPIASFN